MPDKQTMTVCKYEAMTGFCDKLNSAHDMLTSVMDDADAFLDLFNDTYEGTTNVETENLVNELKEHLDRLTMFYQKMGEFMLVVAESFQTSDTTMKNNMEG